MLGEPHTLKPLSRSRFISSAFTWSNVAQLTPRLPLRTSIPQASIILNHGLKSRAQYCAAKTVIAGPGTVSRRSHETNVRTIANTEIGNLFKMRSWLWC